LLKHGITNGMDDTIIKGLFQQLNTAEADHFVQKLQNIMMEWDGRCIGENKSAGAVLKMATSGRGQLTLTTIRIGPLRD